DLAKLFWCLQPPLRTQRVRHLLSLWTRLSTDLTGRIDCALLLHGRGKIGHGQNKFGKQIRFDPDAHCVVAGAKKPDLTHTWHTVESVVDIDVRVVGEKQRI